MAVLAAVAATQAPAATNATPRWHVLPFAPGQGQWFSVLGSASGRVWFNVEGATGFTVWSARVRGGALTSFVSTPEGRITAFSDAWLSGSTLVSCCQGQEGVVNPASRVAPLQPSGKVGAWAPIAGNPEDVARSAVTPASGARPGGSLARAMVTVAGRPIWAIAGQYCPGAGTHQCTVNSAGIATFALCCTAAGGATDISSLLTDRAKVGPTNVTPALDSRGRVWLAWADSKRATVYPGTLNLVQIDTDTLAPSGAKKLDTAAVVAQTRTLLLACGALCRIVYQTPAGAFSWGGDGAPTKLLAQHRVPSIGVLAAGYRGGRLAIAYTSSQVDDAQPTHQNELLVASGDSRGRGLKVVASTYTPYAQPTLIPAPAFTPWGVVATVVGSAGGGVDRLQGMVLRG